jgi:hypothetical protein
VEASGDSSANPCASRSFSAWLHATSAGLAARPWTRRSTADMQRATNPRTGLKVISLWA